MIHEVPAGTSPLVEEALQYYPDPWRAKIQSLFQACADHGTAFDEEVQIQTARGRRIWVRVMGKALRNAEGEVIRVHGALQDIHEQKMGEEALRESEHTLSVLMFNLPCVVYLFRQDGKMLRWNRELERASGYTPGEISNMVPEQFFAQEDLETVRERVTEAMTAGHTRTELALVNKQGLRIPYFYSASRIDLDGQPCLLGVGVDVSQQRAAEERLRQQADLLDKAQDAILAVGLDHRINYWNKGAERIFGWTADQAASQIVTELLHPHPNEFQQALDQTLASGEWTGEMRARTKYGQPLIIESRWNLVRDDNGRPRSLLVVNTNITERKHLEKQIFRAQRMESIGTLAGGMAHDLNNILSPIMMSVDLLRLGTSDPGSQDLLGNIASCARRGADTISQVLSFARGVEGRREEVRTGPMVADIEKIIRDTFPKNIQIRTWLGRDLWSVTGDVTQLQQVLLNLCVNSRDAMPDGGQITISVENVSLNAHQAALNLEAKVGPYVRIQVEDTGTGISPGIIDKIFDPFFTTKELGQGTGLGLSTSLAIVKSHGGYLQPRSEPGQGTRFRIFLPARQGEDSRPAENDEAKVPRGCGETILVVDDEAPIRLVTRHTLEAYGYQVLLASDGAEAVSTYLEKRHSIALVITDMMMPVMDGAAMIKVLIKMNPAVKIVIVSGINATDYPAQAPALGVKHFLAKPYTAQKLLKVVKDVITT
jgi:PAS domain S-box-containing protein